MTGDSVPFSVRAQIMCPFLMFLYRTQSCNYDIYTLYHVSPMQPPIQYIYTLTTSAYNNCTKLHHNTTSPHLYPPDLIFGKFGVKCMLNSMGIGFGAVISLVFIRCSLHRFHIGADCTVIMP